MNSPMCRKEKNELMYRKDENEISYVLKSLAQTPLCIGKNITNSCIDKMSKKSPMHQQEKH
jgi:hypothetical protein